MALQVVMKSGAHINIVSRDQMQEFQPIELTGQIHQPPPTPPPMDSLVGNVNLGVIITW